jgi:hypothetical protein
MQTFKVEYSPSSRWILLDQLGSARMFAPNRAALLEVLPVYFKKLQQEAEVLILNKKGECERALEFVDE